MTKPIILALLPLAALMAQDADVFPASNPSTGAVYAMTNAAANQLVTFSRASSGQLTWAASTSTGGAGTGVYLGSNSAVQITKDQHWLLTVNAGSNTVSVFQIGGVTPQLISTIASGGAQPISVAVYGDLVYVLNQGSPANVSGFQFNNGQMTAIPGSTRLLSTAAPQAPQVGFDDDGGILIVTEKATNLIDTYVVAQNGAITGPNSQRSAGQTPFGFLFDSRGHLLVSDAFGGAAGESAASSYNLASDGSLALITGPVFNGQAASCWVSVTHDNRYLYTSNTDSNDVSAYSLDHDGALRLLGDGNSAPSGAAPADQGISQDNRFLYVLNSGGGTISGYQILTDGGLSGNGTFGSLPLSTTGIAVR